MLVLVLYVVQTQQYKQLQFQPYNGVTTGSKSPPFSSPNTHFFSVCHRKNCFLIIKTKMQTCKALSGYLFNAKRYIILGNVHVIASHPF